MNDNNNLANVYLARQCVKHFTYIVKFSNWGEGSMTAPLKAITMELKTSKQTKSNKTGGWKQKHTFKLAWACSARGSGALNVLGGCCPLVAIVGIHKFNILCQ